MSTLSTSKILICIYTCNRDAESVAELKDTDWFKDVSSRDNFEIIQVLADPSIKEEYAFKNNILTLKTEESYDNLCIKTYKMIDACSKLFNFDYLLKIDSSIIKNNHISVSPAFSFYNFENKFKENFSQNLTMVMLKSKAILWKVLEIGLARKVFLFFQKLYFQKLDSTNGRNLIGVVSAILCQKN